MKQNLWTDDLESDNYVWGFQHINVAKRAIPGYTTTALTLGFSAGGEVRIQNLL